MHVENDCLPTSLRSVATSPPVSVHDPLRGSFTLSVVPEPKIELNLRHCIGEKKLYSLVAPFFRGFGVRFFGARDELFAETLARDCDRFLATRFFKDDCDFFVFISVFLLRFGEAVAHVFNCTDDAGALSTVVQHVRELVPVRAQ